MSSRHCFVDERLRDVRAAPVPVRPIGCRDGRREWIEACPFALPRPLSAIFDQTVHIARVKFDRMLDRNIYPGPIVTGLRNTLLALERGKFAHSLVDVGSMRCMWGINPQPEEATHTRSFEKR